MQNHNVWFIPGVQSIHIIGIALIVGSAFMIDLRILGWAGMDQTLQQTSDRFGPWLKGSLWLLLTTGLLMVIAEPERELITLSFWMKMFLVLLTAVVASLFHSKVRTIEQQWEEVPARRSSLR